ncbi:unnamed protein product [Prunus brigantina]
MYQHRELNLLPKGHVLIHNGQSSTIPAQRETVHQDNPVIHVEISTFWVAGPADFKKGFLSTPTTNSSKTGPVRTSTLPSSNPSYSPPRSAAVVTGISHKTGGFGQIFLKLSPAVSPSSSHQTGLISLLFMIMPHEFRGRLNRGTRIAAQVD